MIIDKNGEKITKNIFYILQFIDSGGFMTSTLSNLVKNFLKEFKELNVNLDTIIKNVKHLELSVRITTDVLNTQTLKII